MPRDPYVRDKFTREIKTARKVARDYFERYPRDRYETEVESWADIQSYNIEFVMRRLREPKAKTEWPHRNVPDAHSLTNVSESSLMSKSVLNRLANCARNLLIALLLFGHETDANHFREESRCPDLDWRSHLHDWRDDLRALR
jgi:hypothetical protein